MIQRFLTTILLMLCTSIFALGQNKITGIIVDADDEEESEEDEDDFLGDSED